MKKLEHPAGGGLRRFPGVPGKWLAAGLVACLVLWTGVAAAREVVVDRLGLSRIGDRTELLIILKGAANPRVAPQAGGGRSQLVVDFPLARPGQLPPRLAGDEVLVQQVRVESAGTGVKIILEMNPRQPYVFSRDLTPRPGGQTLFRLSLRADPDARQAARPTPEPAPSSPRDTPWVERTPEAATPPAPGAALPPPTGTFAELSQLVPRARPLLDFLRGEGFAVSDAKNYDRPGQRLSRGFILTNAKYPEVSVRVAHLPPSAPGAPAITILDLALDQLRGETADNYRDMRTWSFSKIRGKYEDIGDFFEDGMKPLRVELRKQCQSLAQRYAHLFTGFLRQVAPQRPQLATQAMDLIRQKPSPRFEGVQHTLSENPLVILNQVDFLYIRVYFLEKD